MPTLVNVETEARKYPKTFKIATRAARVGLRPGDQAKLIFRTGRTFPNGERMWVTILRRVGKSYEGRLDNTPMVTKGLRNGSMVRFGPQHVADFLRKRIR